MSEDKKPTVLSAGTVASRHGGARQDGRRSSSEQAHHRAIHGRGQAGHRAGVAAFRSGSGSYASVRRSGAVPQARIPRRPGAQDHPDRRGESVRPSCTRRACSSCASCAAECPWRLSCLGATPMKKLASHRGSGRVFRRCRACADRHHGGASGRRARRASAYNPNALPPSCVPQT